MCWFYVHWCAQTDKNIKDTWVSLVHFYEYIFNKQLRWYVNNFLPQKLFSLVTHILFISEFISMRNLNQNALRASGIVNTFSTKSWKSIHSEENFYLVHRVITLCRVKNTFHRTCSPWMFCHKVVFNIQLFHIQSWLSDQTVALFTGYFNSFSFSWSVLLKDSLNNFFHLVDNEVARFTLGDTEWIITLSCRFRCKDRLLTFPLEFLRSPLVLSIIDRHESQI